MLVATYRFWSLCVNLSEADHPELVLGRRFQVRNHDSKEKKMDDIVHFIEQIAMMMLSFLSLQWILLLSFYMFSGCLLSAHLSSLAPIRVFGGIGSQCPLAC